MITYQEQPGNTVQCGLSKSESADADRGYELDVQAGRKGWAFASLACDESDGEIHIIVGFTICKRCQSACRASFETKSLNPDGEME